VRTFVDQNLESVSANGYGLSPLKRAGLASTEAIAAAEAAQAPSGSTASGQPRPTKARPQADSSGLTGLGATRSVFDAHHTPNNEAINSAGVNGVDSVQTIAGRVTGFVLDLNAKPPLNQGEAGGEAQAELPHDPRVVRVRRPDPTCAQIFYRSDTLNRVIGEGVVLIEFESGNPGDPYRASAVDAATFTALPSVNPSPPC